MTDMHITTRQQLVEINNLAADLPALLTTRSQPETGSRTGGAAIAHSPAPVRLDILHALDTRIRDHSDDAEARAWHDRLAADHRQGLIPDLYQWCKLIDAEARDTNLTPADLPDPPTLSTVTGWLHTHLDWALTQHWSGELVRDVDWWWRRVRHLTGERDPYQPRCTLCLFPYVEAEGGWWRCQGCGTEKSIDTGLKQLTEPLVTISQAAALTGTPLRTLRRYAEGLLPVTQDDRMPHYRLRDLQHAIDNPPRRGRPAETP